MPGGDRTWVLSGADRRRVPVLPHLPLCLVGAGMNGYGYSILSLFLVVAEGMEGYGYSDLFIFFVGAEGYSNLSPSSWSGTSTPTS